MFGATNADTVYIHAHANIRTLLGYTHRQVLADMVPMPLCDDSLTANQNNENGKCPGDGSYSFSTAFTSKAPSSDFGSWLLTGYKGELVVNLYWNSDAKLAGRCHADIATKPSMWAIPSGMLVTLLFLLIVLGYIAYAVTKRYRPQWLAKSKKKVKALWGGSDDVDNLMEHDQEKTNKMLTKHQWVMV